MAANKTLSKIVPSSNSVTTIPVNPRLGIVTLQGYGINVRVERGHLHLEDGVADERRKAHFARVGHGLKRLIVIGADGIVSLSALRWLSDQNACFVMLDRNGRVLATTGPVRSSDARLRRAQALGFESGAALRISRELIARKLEGQAKVAREKLLDDETANHIAELAAESESADTLDRIRFLEAKGANIYWSLWGPLPVNFPKKDLARIPTHWLTFGSRKSPLSGSQRLAVSPPNAMLNYLYALLEAEARLAAAALGLDPGLGFLHLDTPARDSLACDLMEPVRPIVDAYLLDWITRETVNRSWFFEQRDGNCRLMSELTERLSRTAPTWARAVAPYAEWVAQTLWIRKRPSGKLPTRLTQQHKSEAKAQVFAVKSKPAPRPPRGCLGCGAETSPGKRYCVLCQAEMGKTQFAEAAKRGRVASHTAQAESRRAETQRRQNALRNGWIAANHPAWLDAETYTNKIQPKLAQLTCTAIASALSVSLPYATKIRGGWTKPHPRHWQILANLVGVTANA